MSRPARKARTRKYRVLYAVTRSEYYEILAENPKEAEDRAFSDGELIEHSGETTDVVACDVEDTTA
jgi:hypothetical protein